MWSGGWLVIQLTNTIPPMNSIITYQSGNGRVQSSGGESCQKDFAGLSLVVMLKMMIMLVEMMRMILTMKCWVWMTSTELSSER